MAEAKKMDLSLMQSAGDTPLAAGEPRAPSRRKQVPTEPILLRLPQGMGYEIRVQAAIHEKTQSDLMAEAWELWKEKHGKTTP